jgi:hypothetical protein
VLPESGGVVCWGAKDGGVWIEEYPDDIDAAPTPVVLAEEAVALALGFSHNCIIRRDGTVACWGANDFGQLGNGKDGRRPGPQPVPGVEGAVHIAVGNADTCAVLRDQSLRCWGGNKSGQLTPSFPEKTTTPKPLDVGKVVSTVLGISHSCALLTNGKIKCWGENYYGQLGTGTSEPPKHPRPPAELQGIEGVRMMIENAALLSDGSVAIWGEDHTGLKMTLDEVDGIVNRTPTRVPAFRGAIAIGGDMSGTCTLDGTGKLRCRGIGPLGDGKRRNSATPIEVQAGTQLLTLALNGQCVLDAQQQLVCWGLNKSQRFRAKGPWVLTPAAVAGVDVLTSGQAHP